MLLNCGVGENLRVPWTARRLNQSILKEVSEVKSLSRVRLFATPWTAAYKAPLSMGFSRQEYRSRLPFPTPEDLPDPGIELASPMSSVFASRFLPLSHLCFLGKYDL